MSSRASNGMKKENRDSLVHPEDKNGLSRASSKLNQGGYQTTLPLRSNRSTKQSTDSLRALSKLLPADMESY